MIKFITFMISLFSITAFAENVSFKLETKNLKAVGQVSSLTNKPIHINGYDLAGTPYKLEITRAMQSKNFVNVGYTLERNGSKQNGSIITEIGHTAKLEIQKDDSSNPEFVFETTITE